MPPSSNSPFPSDQLPLDRGSLDLAMTGGKVGLWDWNVVTQEVKWTDPVYAIHGVDPATFEVTLENGLGLIHPEDRARVQKSIQNALEKDLPYELEFRIRRPDGKEAWVFTNATVVRDEGRPVRMLGSLVDITARRHVDDASRWLAAIVDSSDDAIISKNLNSIITSWNAGAQRLFGYTAREMIGRPVTVLMPADRKAEEIGLLDRIRRGERVEHFETVRQRKDGTLVEVSITVSPVKDAAGRIVGASKIARDISERRRALEESEKMHRQLMAGLPIACYSLDAAGRLVFFNEAAVELWGRRPVLGQEHWCGSHEMAQLDGQPLPLDQCPAAVALKSGQPVRGVEALIIRPNGQRRWVVPYPTPLFDPQGRCTGLINVIPDVTEQRLAQQAVQQSERQLRLVTDHAPVYLAQLDREHRFKFVNRSYADRFDLTREEIIGRHVSELTGPAAYAIFRQHMDACFAGRRIEFEQEISYTKLGPRWVHVTYEPERTEAGEIVGLVAVIMDITTRKEAELELARARDEALAAARTKDEFLASLSHELRTPLNPVLLLASDAASNPALPPAIRESFETIRRNISLEARLIDDLLDLTRIARGKLQLEKTRVDVHTVLHEAVAISRTEIEAKHLKLQLFLGARHPVVLGDAVRLQQVFLNVLQNAVKFTSGNGQITVVSRIVPETDQLNVEIADNGMGMSPVELANVFSAFSQGEHAAGSRHFGGLGLGLAIARQLVELQGGRIHAASPGRNRGSVFVVELPLAGSEERTSGSSGPATPAAPIHPASRPPFSILLVEDHVSTRETLQKLLARRNYEVVAAGTVADALARASARPFDFLVSDVGLPDGDGYQLMTAIRKIHPTLQGIALSGYGMEEDLQRSHAGGFANHLVKPVSIGALEQALSVLPVAPLTA